MSTDVVKADTVDVAMPATQVSAFSHAILRATAAVEAETLALKNGGRPDLKAFEHRKSQALLDLSRAQAGLPKGFKDAVVQANLVTLRGVLSDNLKILSHHMDAVREITQLLSRSLLEADSDGTYSQRNLELSND